MSRPRKGATPAPPTVSTKVPSKTPKMRRPQPLPTMQRVGAIGEREQRLALRARARKKLTLLFSLEEYEQVLAWAEEWDEDVSSVVRACFRRGAEHFRGWTPTSVTPTTSTSPFNVGTFNPVRPAQLDPAGTAYVPAPIGMSFSPSARWVPTPEQPPPPSSRFQRAPTTTVVEEYTEPYFGPRQAPTDAQRRGLLPQGHTDSVVFTPPPEIEMTPPMTPVHPYVPQEPVPEAAAQDVESVPGDTGDDLSDLSLD